MSDTDEGQAERNPFIAAVLAAIVPGLGHLYAREFARALLWLSLFALTVVFLLPTDTLASSLSLATLEETYASAPDIAVLLVAIVGMNVFDAYLTVRRGNQRAKRGPTCPHCGQELDGDLDFCHWCTTRIEATDNADT